MVIQDEAALLDLLYRELGAVVISEGPKAGTIKLNGVVTAIAAANGAIAPACLNCGRLAEWKSATHHWFCLDCRNGVDPEQHGRLGKTLDVFKEWLHLPNPDHVVAALGAVAADLLDGDPVWILFVGAPGSGKTEAIQPLARLEYVHPAATLTEPALLSGTPKKSAESDATGGLLRQIGDFGIILIKDFSGVLSMHREQKAAVLAALRGIYDGSWSRPVGTDGGRVLHWSGHAGVVGAVTPSIDHHTSVMGALGQRFVLYRLDAESLDAKTERALANFGEEQRMRGQLADAVELVLDGVERRKPAGLTAEEVGRMASIAGFAARARSAVERDGYNRRVVVMPEYEHATRLSKQLAQLRAGILAVGADDATAWRIVTKVALDTIPRLRWNILKALRSADHHLKTGELVSVTGIPRKTLDEHVDDLTLLKLVKREKAGASRTSPWVHRLANWVRDEWPEGFGEIRQIGSGHGEEPDQAPS
ncbi:MAG: hypothetical protein IH818_11835 [Acidobacteria bacterium]|nr:hypothetical protein [Acidobacteriota bacterium]